MRAITHPAHLPSAVRGRAIRQPIRALPASTSNPVVVKQDAATWAEFAARFEGEWEGVSAAFSPDGSPQPLPEHYVPDAYREWGVELFDWQTQCSCSAGGGEREMSANLRRLMPTVGCEADAVAFTEQATSTAPSGTAGAGGGGPANAGLAYLPDGSYSSGPVSFDSGPDGASKLRFEACFAADGLSAEGALKRDSDGGAAPRYRLKVAHNLMRNWADGGWRLASVELHRERYDGPFTGRKELAGCGGGQPPISSLPKTAPEQLEGSWAPEAAALLEAPPDGGAPAPAPAGAAGALGAVGAAAGLEGAVLTPLPLGAWSVVRLDGAGGVYVEAGALAAGGRRQVAARSYAGGAVARVVIGTERAAA